MGKYTVWLFIRNSQNKNASAKKKISGPSFSLPMDE